MTAETTTDRAHTRRPRSRRWARRLILVVAALATVIDLAGLILHYGAFRTLPWMALAAGSGYLLLGAPAALVVLLLGRQWIAAAVAGALALTSIAVLAPRFVGDTAPAGATRLVALTANLRLGEGDPGTVVRYVREHHVQVLMLEELTAPERARLASAGLDELLPYNVVDARPVANGTGLWSAYPLTDEVKHTNFEMALVTARLTLDPAHPELGPMVAALHMAGPLPGVKIWAQDIGKMPALLQSLARSSGVVIVGGDFNSTLDNAQFRHLLTGGYADAADQAGTTTATTYPADRSIPPLIAIDHVLSRDGTATSVQSLHVPGSDHRALLVDLTIR